jgi:hypothetical protein
MPSSADDVARDILLTPEEHRDVARRVRELLARNEQLAKEQPAATPSDDASQT